MYLVSIVACVMSGDISILESPETMAREIKPFLSAIYRIDTSLDSHGKERGFIQEEIIKIGTPYYIGCPNIIFSAS